MKIAIPSSGTQVDPHFGHCEYFTVVTVSDGNIAAEEKVQPPAGCGCKTNIVDTLAAMGVNVMLAGNMGGGAVQILEAHGIEVVRGCSGDIRGVVDAWLSGNIKDSGIGCTEHGDHEACDHEH